jgi:membrane protein implicated in regulation of membrane protease activity
MGLCNLSLLTWLAIAAAAAAWFALCLLVGWLATLYERSAGAWFLLAMLFSPLAAFVFLLVANVPHAAVVRREREDRLRRAHPERADIREAALGELSCPKCGATLNPATGDGLRSSDDEPWRLFCNQCGTEIEP